MENLVFIVQHEQYRISLKELFLMIAPRIGLSKSAAKRLLSQGGVKAKLEDI